VIEEIRQSTKAELVQNKVEELRSRSWKCAGLSATGAAIPVPGVSLVADLGIILCESIFYFEQLGLDSESLKRTAKLCSLDYKKIQSIVRETLRIRGVGAVTVETMKTILKSLRRWR